jgi:hypothetical protein
MRVEEIVPGKLANIGACNAAKPGMGSIWFTLNGRDLLWRKPFPKGIQDQIVSFSNPKEKLTNLDLELAGTIVHQRVLADNKPTKGETAHTFCDNTPLVAWCKKSSTTATKLAAYLLRLVAQDRAQQACNHQMSHISSVNNRMAGVNNRMADDASRLWGSNDSELLNHFNSTYPQKRLWELCPPNKQLSSKVISTLSLRKLPAASPWHRPNRHKALGMSGWTSVSPSMETRDLVYIKTQS